MRARKRRAKKVRALVRSITANAVRKLIGVCYAGYIEQKEVTYKRGYNGLTL